MEYADKVIYGNFITMDESNPNANAVAIKGKVFIKVGSKEDVKPFINENTEIIDYGEENFIYPGFIEGHGHVAIFSMGINENCCLMPIECELYKAGDLKGYASFMNEFIKSHPDFEIYQGYGFWVTDTQPTAKLLDDLCPDAKDKPIFLIDGGGHTGWLNTAAIKKFIGDTPEKVAHFIDSFGEDCVILDENGYPTGYLVETPRCYVLDQIPHSVELIKNAILFLQDRYMKYGYTCVGDCSIVENDLNKQVTAFRELYNEGKLKIKFRAYYEITEYSDRKTRDEELEKAIKFHEEFKDNDYFQIIGTKSFLDGVPEALTAYTLKEYPENSGKRKGYHGVARWEKYDDELKRVVTFANAHDLSVQLHTMGDAAVKQGLDAYEFAAKTLLKPNQKPDFRNGLAHCALADVDESKGINDIKRFADLGVTAIVPPAWAGIHESAYVNEIKTFRKNEVDELYKVNSYIKAGANVAFHTDGMSFGGVPQLMFDALTRMDDTDPEHTKYIRGKEECIDAMTALKCLTVNDAYLLRSEKHLGMIKQGMDADMVIYNNDYSKDEVAKDYNAFVNAKLVAVFTNGDNKLSE